ncbi:MAG: serine/threonine-protein phosphatase, partial [Spirochaetes bacterium]|nr:serine/threonine-protein phosphatase [Spirochaetota bacterium]
HAKGRPLGIIKNQEFQTKEISFNNGDMMILYTDGIIEANNMNNDEFGIERFEKTVANFRHMPPAELAGKITDEIEKFISGAPQFDDMTLFIFKFE